MSFRKIDARPTTVNIGAEIHGVDLAKPLDDETVSEIHEVFLRHQVIFFRDQILSRDQHVGFGRRFGELHIHPAAPSPEGHPEISLILADRNSTIRREEVRHGKRIVARNVWHSDVSCDAEPPLGSILYLREVPEVGGDAMFASMYAAYEALSEPMKRFLSGLTAVHSGEHVYRGRYRADLEIKDRSAYGYGPSNQFPEAEHPIIHTHPGTGRGKSRSLLKSGVGVAFLKLEGFGMEPKKENDTHGTGYA